MRPVGETEFVNGMAAICASGYCGKTRVAAGIVGYADLRLGSRVEPVLAALQRAGGDRFRGIRNGTAWDADTSLLNPNNRVPPGLLGETGRAAVVRDGGECHASLCRDLYRSLWDAPFHV
jgi:L-fuconolactonase